MTHVTNKYQTNICKHHGQRREVTKHRQIGKHAAKLILICKKKIQPRMFHLIKSDASKYLKAFGFVSKLQKDLTLQFDSINIYFMYSGQSMCLLLKCYQD